MVHKCYRYSNNYYYDKKGHSADYNYRHRDTIILKTKIYNKTHKERLKLLKAIWFQKNKERLRIKWGYTRRNKTKPHPCLSIFSIVNKKISLNFD